MKPTLRDKRKAIEDAVYVEYYDIDDFFNDDEPKRWTFADIAEHANDFLQESFPGTDEGIWESDVETFWIMG